MTAQIFSRPVSRTRLYEEVEHILLSNIIRGELPAGSKLPTERLLANNLNVNRSTIREALGKLESLDLVEIRHGDGAYVKDYLESGSLELIREMIHLDKPNREGIIRALLEFRTITAPEMAYLAANNRTAEHISQLEEVNREDNALTIVEKDVLVHHIIALASGNILYVVLLNFFNKFMDEYGFLYFEDSQNQVQSLKFHKDICAAIKAGNAAKSRRIMRRIMEYSQDAVIRTMPGLAVQGGI
ncbi:MAG TPA: FadR family transcriptional regulator [Deltaproteobacteria bacterium]|nr:FadR family transcriptional regulator [Deltaproteobacteria bacterium]